MWSHDLLNHSFLEEYTKTLEFHGARSLNTWKSSELCGKSSSKNYTLGLTYHIHTHHHFIRNTAKLPSCEYAAKVSSKRLKNKTNWAIVYMAWENCSTFFFLIDVTTCFGTTSRLNHTHVSCMSHCRFQRCSDSNLATFWNLGLEIFSNKSVDFFLI